VGSACQSDRWAPSSVGERREEKVMVRVWFRWAVRVGPDRLVRSDFFPFFSSFFLLFFSVFFNPL
jgi:hypothetical protein